MNSVHNEEINKVKQFIYNDNFQAFVKSIKTILLPINFFKISGMGSQEIKHSNVLAWMFGDNPHQLEHKILTEFLGKVVSLNDPKFTNQLIENLRRYVFIPENKRHVNIHREWERTINGKSRKLDILIEDQANRVVIAIENKVWAGEDPNQLSDYREIIDDNFADWERYFIFLTPDTGERQPEQSGDSEPQIWLKAGYEIVYDVIDTILEENRSAIPGEARMVFESYNDLLIREGIVSNKELEKLCAEIWQDQTNKEALDTLIKYRPDNTQKINTIILHKLRGVTGFDESCLRKQNKGHIFEFPLAGSDKLVGYYLEFYSKGIYLKLSLEKDVELNDAIREGIGFRSNSISKSATFNQADWNDIIDNMSLDEPSLEEKIRPDINACLKQIDDCEKILQEAN